jgi:hypothetical protein
VRVALILWACQLIVLTACQPAAPIAAESTPGTTSTGGGSVSTSNTPALGIDLRVPPTRAARPSPTPALPAARPSTVASGSPVASVNITLADNGRTITLRNGERALVNLGDEFDWTVQVEDDSIVSRILEVNVIRGAQGMYGANRVGRTALSAIGEPPCRKQQPACGQPSQAFNVTIVVQ